MKPHNASKIGRRIVMCKENRDRNNLGGYLKRVYVCVGGENMINSKEKSKLRKYLALQIYLEVQLGDSRKTLLIRFLIIFIIIVNLFCFWFVFFFPTTRAIG